MLGRKERVFKVHSALCLEDLIPDNHFYRQVEAKLDLSFVRELVEANYAPRLRRPYHRPDRVLQITAHHVFEGICPDRQLMEQVKVNLAHRWFLGYDLDEAVPDHSSLSKIRDRFGLEVFQQYFEVIVERCCAAGLVWGKELYSTARECAPTLTSTSKYLGFTGKPNSICEPCLAVNLR